MMLEEPSLKRSKNVYKREGLGHWEGDTVESRRNVHERKPNIAL